MVTSSRNYWFLPWFALWSCSSSFFVTALFKEDAGLFDFEIATSGHGVTRYSYTYKEFVVSSDSSSSSSSSSSCYIGCRTENTGELIWRRNVCSSGSSSSSGSGVSGHVIVGSEDLVYTMDGNGVVRAWAVETGDLLWDTLTAEATVATKRQLWTYDNNMLGAVVDEVLYFLDTQKGTVASKIHAGHALAHAGVPNYTTGDGKPQWLRKLTSDSYTALVGWVQNTSTNTDLSDGLVTASQMTLVQLEATTVPSGGLMLGQATHFQSDDYIKDIPFSVASMQLVETEGQSPQVLAMTLDRTKMMQLWPSQTTSDYTSTTISASELHPSWTTLKQIIPSDNNDGIVSIQGHTQQGHGEETTMALFVFHGEDASWRGGLNEEESNLHFSAVAFSSVANIMLAVQPKTQTLLAWRISKEGQHRPLKVLGENTLKDSISEHDDIASFAILSCNEQQQGETYDYLLSTLISTESGTTTHVSFITTAQNNNEDTSATLVSKIGWTSEDGLGQVSSGMMLDSSHLHVEDLSEEEVSVAQRLKFYPRLKSQVDGIVTRVRSLSLSPKEEKEGEAAAFSSDLTATTAYDRDHTFGFNKVAVLLSESVHRVWGIHTSGTNRGLPPVYKVDLPKQATWHKLVHGTTNSPNGIHGINGGTHTNDVLVVSSLSDNKVEWVCFAGTNGMIHGQGSLTSSSSSPVVQIIPLVAGDTATTTTATTCKQRAVLIHEDHSMSFIPNEETKFNQDMVRQQIHTNRNGFYTHVIHPSKSRIEALQIIETDGDDDESSSFETRLLGKTSFPKGEKIIHVEYPNRDENVQSPCTVLGDESLLLKYLNPHLAVVMTVKDTTTTATTGEAALDPFAMALKDKSKINTKTKNNNDKQQQPKRKPAGATQPGSSDAATTKTSTTTATTTEDEPNLFVNIIDTVSGRILNRVSHTNAAVSSGSSTTSSRISSIISENWIYYTFVNSKTRKTELGIITLYEGMIHSKGITAFSSPEQITTFSSLDARESKPVVLAATYSLPKPATALGITVTRSGISPKQLIIATSDSRIFTVERRMLEPRRPIGEVKESEKKEGLHQYSELIPLISLQSVSYDQTVQSVSKIISSATDLESQSLILAFGGPDIFFTRTSPSKSFDLLPESFNRILLSLVVTGLLVVLVLLNRMSKSKMVRQEWI